MTAWTGYDTSYLGSVYVADLGYYIGPFPPPLPVFLPTDAQEVVLYVVRAPVSGSPADWDASHADYPYENLYGYGTSRWDTTPGDSVIDSSSFVSNGLYPYTPDPTSYPPAARLWVVWYPAGYAAALGGPAPSVPPEDLVPPELLFEAVSPGYTLTTLTSYTQPAYAQGVTNVTVRYTQPAYAHGVTTVTVAGIAFHTVLFGHAQATGATTVTVSPAIDGVISGSAYSQGATVVTVRNAGPIDGAASSIGATRVSVQYFQGNLFGAAESDGSTLVYIRYFPDLSDNVPVSLCVHLDGQLSYAPVDPVDA